MPYQNVFERVAEIQRVTAKVSGVTLAELTGPCRPNTVVNARFAAILLCRRETGESTPRLGKMFGNRDHGTILWALRKAQNWLKTDPEFKALYEAIEAELKNNSKII